MAVVDGMYLKLGLEEAEDSPGDEAPDSTSIDAENRDQVPVSRGLERNALRSFHRRRKIIHKRFEGDHEIDEGKRSVCSGNPFEVLEMREGERLLGNFCVCF